jgi:hypothetical protein
VSGGGIINDRAVALLHAAHKSCFYGSMSAGDKAKVDAIEAKRKSAPTSLDADDCVSLMQILDNTLHS